MVVKIVFIRGSPGAGKTTVTKEVLKILKTEHKLHCAYICEDDFRKQMQFKYKAKDLIAHQNSFELIKVVILKLLKLDSYDLLFIEGQFRYKEILDKYSTFVSKNKFESIYFQFVCDLKERCRRDAECRTSKGLTSQDVEIDKDIESTTPKNAIIVDTKQSIEETIEEVLARLI